MGAHSDEKPRVSRGPPLEPLLLTRRVAKGADSEAAVLPPDTTSKAPPVALKGAEDSLVNLSCITVREKLALLAQHGPILAAL